MRGLGRLQGGYAAMGNGPSPKIGGTNVYTSTADMAGLGLLRAGPATPQEAAWTQTRLGIALREVTSLRKQLADKTAELNAARAQLAS